jgi:hypothetical protein
VTSIKVTGYVPKQLFDLDAIRMELLNALRSEGRHIKRDFQKSTRTWKHKPRFDMKVSLRRAQATGFVEVKTDDEIYGYVNHGTGIWSGRGKYPIRPKVRRRGPRGRFRRAAGSLAFPSKFGPKTRPGKIGSSAGSRGGPMVFTKQVMHPGIRPRKFDQAIVNRINKTGRFQRRIDQAIVRGLAKSDKGTRTIG